MSVTYGFYNSLNGDRKYNANHISRFFDGVIKDGIFATYGQAFSVTADGTSMSIKIGTGRAWFDHTWTFNDAVLPIDVELSELIFDRIDALVLEVDTRSAFRKNEIKIIKGVGSSNPVKPTLIKSDSINQYPLAYITVGKGVSTITQANIENMIGKTECPFVTGILEHIDITMLVQQWEAEWDQWTVQQTADFQLWFDTIKGQLSEDAAGNLQNQINALTSRVVNIEFASSYLVPLTGWVGTTFPFTNTINVAGITSAMRPFIDLDYSVLGASPTLAQVEAYEALYSPIYRGESLNESIKLYAKEKPTADFTIKLRGKY